MSDPSPGRRRSQEAAEWLTILRQEEFTSERAADWLEWAHADPANLEAFERTESLSLGLACLDADRKAALLGRILPNTLSRSVPSRRRHFLLALAAAAAVAIVGVGWLIHEGRRPLIATFATGKAENRSFELPDGSKVILGASTRLDVAYTDTERAIALREGEAFFQVKGQPSRPFRVRAGSLHLTDIGTSFDVRKNDAHVTVTVSNGIVDVREDPGPRIKGGRSAFAISAPMRLRAGQRVTVAATAVTPVVAHVNVAEAPSWQRGRLDFQDEPLAVVVANVNRYAVTELVIVDPAVSNMRFTGTVFHDRVADWVASMTHLFNLRAVPAADGRVLLYSNP